MKGLDEEACTGRRCETLTKGKGLTWRQLKGSKDEYREEEMEAAKVDQVDQEDSPG